MSKEIIVRVQSPDHGTRRIKTSPSEKISDFLNKVGIELCLLGNWRLYQNRNKTGEIKPSRSRLDKYRIQHGDMLYLMPGEDADRSGTPDGGQQHQQHTTVVEDEVDQILEKMDGRIHRSRNEQLCRHGPQGKCLHCVPLEPYDEEYLKQADPPIKFLSFHSYIRKLTGGVDKGKFANLENLSCKIKPGCTEHPPWPGGICTKCQPNAVTLNRQKYRHIDYIMFENHFMVDKFLDYWRSTGHQRIGFLYGRYEHHKDVPLGIKATVSAIYEPPQVSRTNSVELLPEDSSTVNRVAAALGLQRVGWIFTDLVAKSNGNGPVKHYRGTIDSHFLSAEECIMAADFQNQHPNPCKLAKDGHFGSKFGTVVVTGDTSNQIHFEGYQVSDQCMALVRDDCLIPTKDAPELGYVQESTQDQYVPDVFYKVIDEYRNEVTQLARPLPVEYLLLDLPAAFPVEQQFTFHAGEKVKNFPIENRNETGEIQDFHALTVYMQQFSREQFLEAMSDFHLLIYLATCDMLPLKDHLDSLLEAVKNKDEGVAYHWSKTEEWGTVEQLMEANAPSPTPLHRGGSFVGPNAEPLPPIPGGATGGGALWTCNHCTFLNQPSQTSCEICNLPR